MTRRDFLRRALLLGAPAVCAVDGYAVERHWLAVREVDLSPNRPNGTRCRIVHFSDTHYRGDRTFLEEVIGRINQAEPDLVCFTGDIVDNPDYLDETLGLFKKIDRPLYGCPGNHDFWNQTLMQTIRDAFAATGGAWLSDAEVVVGDGCVALTGVSRKPYKRSQTEAEYRVLLSHYPMVVDALPDGEFDAVLAGHSHGGQVRLPLIGAPILPRRVGPYDKGLFVTNAGPLHVNPGIGTWHLPVRFLCRPEVTIVTL